MTEREYYLGFSVFPGIGPGRFQSLLKIFSSVKKAYQSEEEELAEVIGKKLASSFVTFRDSFDISEYSKQLSVRDVFYITFEDRHYPQKLRDLEHPPFLLYAKGNSDVLASQQKIIGVVGTRKITSYGRQITEQFTRDLVENDCVIVSGLALGVDAVSHWETVSNTGRAIAVLGCGVDCCYPSTNQNLYNMILKTDGVIISEYPLSASPTKGSFPARNRIIAAFSDGLLVTEGAEDSGSLITAEIALSLKRPVFAIPGPVTSALSKGPLRLIRKGAKLVVSVDEILEELGASRRGTKKGNNIPQGDSKEEQKIIEALLFESLSFDEIVRSVRLEAAQVSTTLSVMEIKGMLKSSEGVFSLIEI